MISKLSDQELHLETLTAAQTEKSATLVLLEHLYEVHRRKLYVDYGHSTLQKYVMKELGFSEGESWTRIQAMKLVESTPLAKEKIESGELPFTNAAIIQSQIVDQGIKDIDQKIKQSLGKSSRELKEEAKPKVEKKIILNERILEKIKKLGWSQTELEVFEALIDEKLKEQETSKNSQGRADNKKVDRYIPIETKRVVLKRSRHKCEIQGCKERRNLQYDHIKPFALGGDRSPKNIRLICWTHNQRRSIQTFGIRI